jgi:hypothetical protein
MLLLWLSHIESPPQQGHGNGSVLAKALMHAPSTCRTLKIHQSRLCPRVASNGRSIRRPTSVGTPCNAVFQALPCLLRYRHAEGSVHQLSALLESAPKALHDSWRHWYEQLGALWSALAILSGPSLPKVKLQDRKA